MPKPATWTEAELAALAKVPPNNRGALARYRAKFPGHTAAAVTCMLAKLRIRGKAQDNAIRLGTAAGISKEGRTPQACEARTRGGPPPPLAGKISFAGYDATERSLYPSG